MTFRMTLLLLLLACASHLRVAHGTERVGDATYVYALEQHERSMTALEVELLSSIATAPEEERFSVYWTYNQILGTWVQVHFFQTLLDLAVAAESASDEEEIRATLREQARFLLWQLDETSDHLEQKILQVKRPNDLRIHGALRSLLSEVRTIIGRLLADQCARAQCSTGP